MRFRARRGPAVALLLAAHPGAAAALAAGSRRSPSPRATTRRPACSRPSRCWSGRPPWLARRPRRPRPRPRGRRQDQAPRDGLGRPRHDAVAVACAVLLVVPLSLANGTTAGLAHLAALAAFWSAPLAALLGVAVHVLTALPDLVQDRTTGLRHLPLVLADADRRAAAAPVDCVHDRRARRRARGRPGHRTRSLMTRLRRTRPPCWAPTPSVRSTEELREDPCRERSSQHRHRSHRPRVPLCPRAARLRRADRPGLQPRRGVDDRSGEVDVLNALVVSGADGSGTLIASLVNNDQTTPTPCAASPAAATTSSLEVTPGGDTAIPAAGLLNLATDGRLRQRQAGRPRRPCAHHVLLRPCRGDHRGRPRGRRERPDVPLRPAAARVLTAAPLRPLGWAP